MAASNFVDADAMRIYNEKALRILETILFAKQSSVAYNVRCRWLRYSPDPNFTLRQALNAIFHALLSATVNLEIGDDYIQVFDSPFLRIPADVVKDAKAYNEIVRGIRQAFAKQTIARPSMLRHYSVYRYNPAFHSLIDRGSIVLNLGEQILSFARDEHYLQIRQALHAVAQELSYHFYNIQACSGRNQDVAMDALVALQKMTAPHSPVIRHLKGSDDGRLTYSDTSISFSSEEYLMSTGDCEMDVD